MPGRRVVTEIAAFRARLRSTTGLRAIPAQIVGGRGNPQILHPHAATPTVVRVPSHCSLSQWMQVAPAMARAGFHVAHNDQNPDQLEDFDPDDDAVQHALAHPQMYPKEYVRMLQALTDQKAALAA